MEVKLFCENASAEVNDRTFLLVCLIKTTELSGSLDEYAKMSYTPCKVWYKMHVYVSEVELQFLHLTMWYIINGIRIDACNTSTIK